MNIRLRSLLALASLLSPALALADTITLKNGDRITGSVVKTDEGNLIFKGEMAGEMKVPLDNITSLTTSAPINVTTKDGQLLVGPTNLDTTRAAVQTANSGTVQADRGNVTAIRSMDEQKTYQAEIDRYAHPGPLDLWAGTFDFGLGLSSGNSQTTAYTMAFNAVRATKRDKLDVYFTSLYSTQETFVTTNPAYPNGKYVGSTAANARRGGLSYNFNLTPKLFAWGSLDLENNAVQQLNLRVNPAGGLGYHAFKNDNGFLDILGGGSYNLEYFAFQPEKHYAEFVIGDEFQHIFNKRSSLHQSFKFFPNLTDTGQYRINFDLTAATALTKALSWQVSLSDRYLSNPPPAIFPSPPIKGNDLIFSTGVRVTFAR